MEAIGPAGQLQLRAQEGTENLRRGNASDEEGVVGAALPREVELVRAPLGRERWRRRAAVTNGRVRRAREAEVGGAAALERQGGSAVQVDRVPHHRRGGVEYQPHNERRRRARGRKSIDGRRFTAERGKASCQNEAKQDCAGNRPGTENPTS